MMKNRLLRLNSPIETKAVLICFPWAGATATGYKMLAKNFNTENILCYSIVFATGKDRPISVKQSTQVAVALIFQELQNLSDLPIYFLGHSYGGIVAFETIRKLENTSVKLNLQTLIVSSVCSPDRLTLLNEAKEDVFHLLSNERLLQKLQDIKGTFR